MSGRLKLYAGPAIEPVSVADLRLFGRISSDVTDATLTPLIVSARKQAEKLQNRAFVTQTWDLVFDSFPTCPIRIPMPPLISLVSVTITSITGAVTTMTLTDFVVDSSGGCGQISLKYNKYWPSVITERAGVVIRFTCGYGAAAANVPDDLQKAVAVGALWLYDHPSEPMTKLFYDLLGSDGIVSV
jgi:uncharacterized phiE125 gp8 family phage protein